LTDLNPDAWRYESVAKTEEKEFRHDAISFDLPRADKGLENPEPLFSGETIQEVLEQVRNDLKNLDELESVSNQAVLNRLEEEFKQKKGDRE